jgi:RNA polymerase sigma-70 factor (ECF subfamily)
MNAALRCADHTVVRVSLGWMTRNKSRSTGSNDTSRDLLIAVGNGDREAYVQLFKFFAPRLKTFLIRRGLDSMQAEELVQDAMVLIWRRARSYDPSRAGAATWIFTIARNLHIDAFRRNSRANSHTLDQVEEIDQTPDAEMLMMAEERDVTVRRALDGLSREQLVIVQSSFFDDKAHSIIAHELGLPLGTVKSRMRLAFARLRKLLDEHR